MLRAEPKLSSDAIRLVAMLLIILGAVGAVAGSVLGFQTPPSPLWLPVLATSVLAAIAGIVLFFLILEGFIAD